LIEVSEGQPRRRPVVLAAYRVLAEKGFEGLRTRDVAVAAGMNVATLHYYFPTKEALVRAVVGHAMTRFRSTLGGGGSATEELRRHFAGLRRLRRQEPELFAVMGELAMRAGRDPAVAKIFKATNDAWLASLRGLLERVRDEGRLPPGTEPEALAELVIGALKGLYMVSGGGVVPARRADAALRSLEGFLGL
jgi:AcrR family transcriptional regulator